MNDPILLVPHDPRWASQFEEEAARLRSALGDGLLRLEHIGSSAVPGLAAKPVLDLIASVDPWPPPEAPLRALGYEDLGENGIPGRRFFRKGSPRTHHLHVVGRESPLLKRHLDFRDRLRARPEEARAYEVLKGDLARRFASDRDRYTTEKTPFVEAILALSAGERPGIRPALAPELPPLLELIHRAYASNAERGFQFVGVSEALESLQGSWEAGTVFVLFLGGALRGSVRLVELADGALELQRLCVEPACRHLGFGSRLLEFAEAEARRRGRSLLRLDTAKPFELLVGWYERKGYRIVGETRFPNVNYPSVILEKRLS